MFSQACTIGGVQLQIIEKQRKHSLERNRKDVGTTQRILIEGFSKRSDNYLQGRTSSNKVVIVPKNDLKKGQYVNVSIEDCTAATLIGNQLVEA